MSNNGLKSVYCVSTICSLQILDISNNLIENISEIVHLEKLEILNASSNKIKSLDQIVIFNFFLILKKKTLIKILRFCLII